MRVRIKKEDGTTIEIPVKEGNVTVKTMRALFEQEFPAYKKKKFLFLKAGKQISEAGEDKEKLSDGDELEIAEISGLTLNIKITQENGMKKVTCVKSGTTLLDLRESIKAWPELVKKDFFFFSSYNGETFCIETSDEGKIVLLEDTSYSVKLIEDLASDLAEHAVDKKESTEEKKKAKEDVRMKQTRERMAALIGGITADIPENKIKGIEDMSKANPRDFNTYSKLIDPKFSAQPDFDVTNDFFSFANDQEMLFDLVTRSGILKGIIVGSTHGDIVQHGFFDVVRYSRPESKDDTYYKKMKNRYMEQLSAAKKSQS